MTSQAELGDKVCKDPRELVGPAYDSGWCGIVRDYKITPCGKCGPCRARSQLGIELKEMVFTRQWSLSDE